MRRFYFRLQISADDYLRYYRGTVATAVVRTTDGRNLSFPASHLRRFVTPGGIAGDFCLTVSDDNRFISLERHQAQA